MAADSVGVINKPGRMAMSYELLLKERDELQREAATANAELFAVLKQSEYRSAEELGLVRAAPNRPAAAACCKLCSSDPGTTARQRPAPPAIPTSSVL